LGPLVHRLGLAGKLGIPYGMRVGSGCTDADLNLIYNAMDLFTLPTTGEGFGLPIAEAMSAGTPVLVTNYSGHMDYVAGAGATIEVSEFETFPVNNCERAIVDMDDYEMKLDQFYMGPDQFWDKWGMFLERQGLLAEQRSMVPIGLELSRETGRRGAERIREHYDWKPICQKWLGMICSILKYDPNAPTAQTTNLIPTEVIQ
jgi:glycosyltransferase involved in cell wall biosynthesis